MWTPRQLGHKKVSMRQFNSPENTLLSNKFQDSTKLFHLRSQSHIPILISPKKILTTQGTQIQRQLKGSQSSKLIGRPQYQFENIEVKQGSNYGQYQHQNELLKDYIRRLSVQLHQLRYHKFTNKQIEEGIISQLYKKLNLKLSIKNTLISKIKKIILQIKNDSCINTQPTMLKSKIDQILELISQNDTNILIKENVFQNESICANKVVIVYRQDGESWRPFKNKNKQQLNKQQIDSEQKNGNQKKSLELEIKNMKMQIKRLKSINLQNEQKIKKLQLDNKSHNQKSNQQYIKSIIQQINYLQKQLKQYQNGQNIIQKERQNILLERKKYKQTIKTLQDKLLYTSIELQTLQLLKQRLSQYENMINHQKNQINNFTDSTKIKNNSFIQSSNQILHSQSNIYSFQKSQIPTQSISQSQTLTYQNCEAPHQNNIQQIDFESIQRQLKQKEQQVIQIKIKLNQAQNIINEYKKKSFNPQAQFIEQKEPSKEISVDIEKHPLYLSQIERYLEIQNALKRAEQYIILYQKEKQQHLIEIQNLKNSYLNQYNQKQNIKKEIQIMKHNIEIQGNLNSQQKQDQYFRYKVDPRYKEVQIKLYGLKNQYYKQANMTKQLISKYQKQHSQSQEHVIEMIKQLFQSMKKFDQTVIIQKSKLKRFNKNKLQSLMKNINQMKQQNIKFKQEIKSEFQKDLTEIVHSIDSQFVMKQL